MATFELFKEDPFCLASLILLAIRFSQIQTQWNYGAPLHSAWSDSVDIKEVQRGYTMCANSVGRTPSCRQTCIQIQAKKGPHVTAVQCDWNFTCPEQINLPLIPAHSFASSRILNEITCFVLVRASVPHRKALSMQQHCNTVCAKSWQ